jgi:hypothetical protein
MDFHFILLVLPLSDKLQVDHDRGVEEEYAGDYHVVTIFQDPGGYDGEEGKHDQTDNHVLHENNKKSNITH